LSQQYAIAFTNQLFITKIKLVQEIRNIYMTISFSDLGRVASGLQRGNLRLDDTPGLKRHVGYFLGPLITLNGVLDYISDAAIWWDFSLYIVFWNQNLHSGSIGTIGRVGTFLGMIVENELQVESLDLW
ncbi:hypothetical protein ACJX0J_031087, partial [Zea mays]